MFSGGIEKQHWAVMGLNSQQVLSKLTDFRDLQMNAGAYSEPCQTSKMEQFAKIVCCF